MADRRDHEALRAAVNDQIDRNVEFGMGPVAPTGLGATKIDWVYDQSTGTLMERPVCYPDSDAAARDLPPGQTPMPNRGGFKSVYPGNYAGKGAGVNNPAMDGVRRTGPLPAGGYDIGPMGTYGGGRLRNALPLEPLDSNDMKGRRAFRIHGGNMQSQGSSEGCIVTDRSVRDDIIRSGDRRLWVVPRSGRPPT